MPSFKKQLIILLTVLLLCPLVHPAWANSAEPPSILIIVQDPPLDLDITLITGDAEVPARKVHKFIETYYTFYSRELGDSESYMLQVRHKGQAFELPLARPAKTYNTIFTLNLETHTLTEGKLPLRNALLIALRVSLTLLLEGAVFWIMGFRSRRTWALFIGINLLTQGVLNLWLSGMMPLESYPILVLIWGEIFVFLAEIIAFKMLVKEHRTRRVIGAVLLANSLSLLAGGWLITRLPL